MAQAAAVAAEPAPAPAAAPAAAPLFQIYGTLNVNLQYTEAGDATAGAAADVAARFAVSSDSSNIGIRGTLPVAHGLSAVYQCESSAVIEAGGGTLCSRNSRVGLSGGFGTLFYGNWDTPFKNGTYGTKAEDPFGNTDVYGYQGIMGSPGFNARSGAWTGTGNVHSFDLRAQNSVAYHTPSFSGLSAKFQWATNEGTAANGLVSPTLVAATVNFDMGGLSLVASGEYHEDAFGLRAINVGGNTGNQASKDMALRLAAGYQLPLGDSSLTVMGMFEQLSYTQDEAAVGANLKDYDRLAWLLGAKFRTGNHEFRARYAQGMDPDCTIAGDIACVDADTKELGAMQYGLGYSYHLGKTTQVYAFLTQISNDDDAQYTLTIGGSPAVAGATPAGADPMAGGLGMVYKF